MNEEQIKAAKAAWQRDPETAAQALLGMSAEEIFVTALRGCNQHKHKPGCPDAEGGAGNRDKIESGLLKPWKGREDRAAFEDSSEYTLAWEKLKKAEKTRDKAKEAFDKDGFKQEGYLNAANAKFNRARDNYYSVIKNELSKAANESEKAVNALREVSDNLVKGKKSIAARKILSDVISANETIQRQKKLYGYKLNMGYNVVRGMYESAAEATGKLRRLMASVDKVTD